MNSDPRPQADDVQRCIEQALQRDAAHEARELQIHVNAGVVTLRGCVHSWHERGLIQDAAASAPCVRRVVNELNVG